MNAIYYECHVTVEPVFGDRLAVLEQLARAHGFKVAKLLMDKGPSTKDSFCTGHARDFGELQERMRLLSSSLLANGFSLWRRKIEAVVFDERLPRTS